MIELPKILNDMVRTVFRMQGMDIDVLDRLRFAITPEEFDILCLYRAERDEVDRGPITHLRGIKILIEYDL